MNTRAHTRVSSALMCVLALTGCASTSLRVDDCGYASKYAAERAASRVQLLARPVGPAYYWFSEGYFILVTQTDALEYLKSHSDAVGMGGLLPTMAREAPISSDTDLLSFALKDGTLIYGLNLLVAGLLENGQAAVIHIAGVSGQMVDYISVRKVSNRNGDFRRFCTQQGGFLFSVVDEIS